MLVVLWCVKNSADAILEENRLLWLCEDTTASSLALVEWLKELGRPGLPAVLEGCLRALGGRQTALHGETIVFEVNSKLVGE